MIHFRFFLLLAFTALLRLAGIAQEISGYTATATDLTFTFDPVQFFSCQNVNTGESFDLFNLRMGQVYVTGDFNGWQAGDSTWKLTSSGKSYTLTVPQSKVGKVGDTVQFKFVIQGIGLEDKGTRKVDGLWRVDAPRTAANRRSDGNGNSNPYLVVGKVVPPVAASAPSPALYPTQPAGGFLISGSLKEAGNHEIRIFTGQHELLATTRAHGGKFALAGTVLLPCVATLQVGEYTTPIFLVIENIVMSINGSLVSGAPLKVKGGKEQAAYDKMELELGKIREPIKTAAYAMMDAEQRGDTANLPALQRQYEALVKPFSRDVFELTRKHKNTLAGVSLLEQFASSFSTDIPFGERMALLTSLPPTLKQLPVVQYIQEIWANEKAIAIGALAPDFTLNDSLGKPVTLSAFRGQYVLVDFWASWCGPCRRENPNVKNAYTEYHPKGLEIIGIAVNDATPAWTTAIRKDGLPWINTLDRDRTQQPVGNLYSITFVPQNFLLDKEGRIIAIGLRGDELKAKLAELMP